MRCRPLQTKREQAERLGMGMGMGGLGGMGMGRPSNIHSHSARSTMPVIEQSKAEGRADDRCGDGHTMDGALALFCCSAPPPC